MPEAVTPERAIQMARARASVEPGHRFRVLLTEAGTPEPRVLWDSHAPS